MAYVTKPKRGRGPGFQRSRTKKEPTSLGITGSQGKQAVRKAKGKPALGIIPSGIKQAETKRDSDENIKKVINNLLKRDTGSRTINKIIKQLRKKIDTGKTSGLEKPMAMSKKGGTISRQAGGKMSHVGLYPAEEKRSGTLPERKRKKGGTMKRKAGGTIKKQVGGLTQGYDARLDESLGARHPAVRGNLAARRAESEGMERALGHRPYSAARTMAKKGGSVSRKKGGTTSRKGGGKIMVGYKAGGKV